MLHPESEQLIRLALQEDIGSGDVTSAACVPDNLRARGYFLARQPLVLAGTDVLRTVYDARGGVDHLELLRGDGERTEDGERFAEVVGWARTLLECERVALNLLQRLSGVATVARQYAERVEGTKCKVLDTRKTTPGMRRLEKAAAAAGGVVNHRIGLFDAVLIKNNHISAAGGVRQALEASRHCGLPVEIEVRELHELHEALECGATHLLLDNLTPAEATEWIGIVDGRAKVELSGGITLETVRDYAEAGADFVSVGAVTHSAPAVDISFRLEPFGTMKL
jgi:nicotinate-nucleotide pyrophosphorylase (carboxylating)